MNKKEIGILTFHRADNLGAVLQAYALQHTIENKFQKNAELIDYRCDVIEQTRYIKKEKSLKGKIKNIFKSVYYGIKRSGFNRFRNEKLKISQMSYNKDDIKECADKYSSFIVGSDQVWNFECSGWDMTYFLDFVPDSKKKISYAASIGNYKYTEEEEKKVLPFLNSMNGISVREDSAKETLELIGINNVATVCDPVFLLEAKEWQSIMKKRLFKGKYVLVYLVVEDVNVLKAAREYANKHNLKLISNKKNIEFILHNSPAEFLSWIYYAECVFTNSFHGTALSLIMGKPFGSDIMLKDGKTNKRVYELLKRADAEKCIISEENHDCKQADSKKFISDMRDYAFDYLGRNL